MDPIKEAVALERFCPHTSQTCVGSRCMAWVRSAHAQRTFVEVDWPADIERPRVERSPIDTPTEYATAVREACEAALKPMVGGKHADTNRTVSAAAPLDFHLAKVRLTLEPELAGSCSLIR